MKKYLRSFSIEVSAHDFDDRINAILKERGATAEDVISVTFYHSGPYQSYTIWYRSERRSK